MTKRSLWLLFLFSFSLAGLGQHKVRLPLWTFHEKNSRIIGLAGGLNYTRKIKDVRVYGVSTELFGLGGLSFMIPQIPISEDSAAFKAKDTLKPDIQINGINISPLGSMCNCDFNGINVGAIGGIAHRANGISIVLIQNFSEFVNGIQIAIGYNGIAKLNGVQIGVVHNLVTISSNGVQIGVVNTANRHRGVQLGIYNKAADLKGLQIGLWNVNSKRSLPIINW